ncbi:methyltransferase, TIGR04325 family [Chelativorans salis]|uniref:Methyltransferase, TIGR04325 family n=1 Tax=Chelativorans salis TaxID=2978478 RepID=A0ABT2LLX0_9HYPH|nr:methyltransferase, TIGR04325 family [Chelativorans sp. EGI FJ00035]MCT7375577.1 methyltransferase, TIGR04325 family [Chelativorans sp. EGI FJ00035]
MSVQSMTNNQPDSRNAAAIRDPLMPFRVAWGRLRLMLPRPPQFSGAYASYEEAFAAAARMGQAGYDHDDVAEIGFDRMCPVLSWDYPVLFWLGQLVGEVDLLVDAGGHMGTKYRAFRKLLPLDEELRWVVYDVPAVVRAGRRRAAADGLDRLQFVERLEDAGAPDLFLGSGLLQYLDVGFAQLLGRLESPPRHLLLNKVALRTGPTVVTLQHYEKLRTPYQIRNEDGFMREVEGLGYRLVDRWTNPSLSHVIRTHPELGSSESAGFYFRLD